MTRIDFVTLFPDIVLQGLDYSILGRAQEAGIVHFGTASPRDFATDKHRTVDDSPYGGGAGMVIRVDVVDLAIQSLGPGESTATVLMDPNARRFAQSNAEELSGFEQVIFLCGHYEGMDHRVSEHLATHRFSLGDFVLTGGELSAMAMADAVVRLLPGVIGDPTSLSQDSHREGLLSYPQYTRPQQYRGWEVPEVLCQGDHGAIAQWRRMNALQETREQRPDIFCRANLSESDLDLL